MWSAVILSLLVGMAIVAQNGANAHLMKSASLWLILLVGNMIAAVASLLFFFAQRDRGSLLEEFSRVPLLVLIPAACGVVITAWLPIAISKIGVFSSVIIVIACQIVASLAWDRTIAGQAVSMTQMLGAALVFGGVVLVMRPGS